MPALIIGEAQRQQIAELKAVAAANPQDPVSAAAAAARNMRAYRDMMATLSVELPVGYDISYSHEKQPTAGLCHHISISVRRAKKMPGTEAVAMILEAFGMRPMEKSDGLWIEDINPVTKALNIVQTIAQTEQKYA